MTEYDKANISWILSGNGDWFTADLFRLIARSDTANKEKLALSFPDEVNAVHEFQTGKPLAEPEKSDARIAMETGDWKTFFDGFTTIN